MAVLSLPPGLERDGAISDMGPVQRLEVRDMRGGADRFARRRILFLFPDIPGQEWADKLRERITRLAGESHVPHVRKPLEIGTVDGNTLYLLTDRPHESLSECLAPDGLVSDDARKNKSWRLIEDVAAGLASLHRMNLFHGGLHSTSVSLDSDGRAWIEDAGWGPLWHWSRNANLPDGIEDFLLKDAAGRPAEPSPSADVYALGMLSLRILLGQKAPWTTDERRDALLHAGAGRRQADLILRMLGGPSTDPKHAQRAALKDAFEVQNELSQINTPFRNLVDWFFWPLRNPGPAACFAAFTVTAALIVCFVVLAIAWRDLSRTQTDLAATRIDLETAAGDLKESRAKTIALEHQITDLASNNSKLERELKKVQSEAEATKVLLNGHIERLTKEIKAYQDNDKSGALTDALKRKQQLEDQLKDTQHSLAETEARRLWLELIYSPELSYQGMLDRIAKVPNKTQREKLNGWVDQFENPPFAAGNGGKWWIELEEGKASTDKKWRMRWEVEVKVGDGDWQILKAKHDWESLAQVYPKDTSVGVTWSRGQPIQVRLTEIGRISNAARIDRVFDGPLSIWQLANSQWLYYYDGEDWVAIKLGVWKCPPGAGKR
jgi:hypothetical protein